MEKQDQKIKSHHENETIQYAEVLINSKSNENKNPHKEENVQYIEINKNHYENKVQEKNPAYFFIAPKELDPLTPNQLIKKAASDISVQEQKRGVMHLAKTVFANPSQLDSKLKQINDDVTLGKVLSNTVQNSPEAISELAGSKIFGIIKSPKRRAAEKHISQLSQEIEKYADTVEDSMKRVIKHHNAKNKRLVQPVKMLSVETQRILDLPKDLRNEILQNQDNSKLKSELASFLHQMNCRFSREEKIMLKAGNCKMLAGSMEISKEKAENIINTFHDVKDLYYNIPIDKTPYKIEISQTS
ncbi:MULTISPECIES: BID domain-containing T4SS effector [unclassified Bartonella]|uniref:BID domain-containing T4SS effector n=1 Tax=unclassified Bartonella TaxID=2645622 RepID=UPI0009998565|nr:MULTISPECIES: BID domain-containing T4SS effector [unclassified Bartonella]AQX28286.1 Bartonella effector protein Bep9/2 [Bartonella sp. JB15]AQX29557.1 Bartonella effector protein Bep9/2 [Bartonella sp. JB63]